MNLSLKSFSQFVQDMGAILQSSSTALVDVSVGSVSRAIIEANAGIGLWMQWLMLQVLQTTRAATSVGTDLDSWMADFGLVRLPATPASGLATFYRFNATLPASIPPGAIVKSSDGSLSFAVVQSPSVSIWNANLGYYMLPAGVTSATVPITCTSVGSNGNVVANTISIIASSLPGIDQVTNPSPLNGGMDAETDLLFRERFVSFLAGLSKATPAAIRSAVANVQQDLTMALLENTAADGTSSPGHFLVTIDDGSGYPDASLLSAVANAIEAVRPVGTSASVIAPVVTIVNVSISIWIPQSSGPVSQSISVVQESVQAYLNTIGIGCNAALSRVIQAAYVAAPDISNVTDVLLNGASQDISPGQTGVIKAGTVTVSINGS
jgi:hypothetical protein